MKKIWLTIAGSLFIALASVNAQDRSSSDTTGKEQTSEYQYQWRDADREAINREDLPSALVETLEGGQYQGWENATIYRNKNSNDYMLVIQDNGTTRTFYFDKEGKERPMNSGNLQGQGNMQSDSSSVNYSGQTGQQDSTYQGQTSSGQQDSTSSSGISTDTAASQDRPTSDLQSGSTTSAGSAGQDSRYQTGRDDRDDQATRQDTTTSSATGERTQTGQDQSAWQSTDKDMPSAEWNKEDRVVITTNELPSSLLITLGDPQYRGWENSTVYRNRKNNQYMIEIRDGSDTRTYYFDKDGKAIINTSGNKVDE
jgi:hypothetical protein